MRYDRFTEADVQEFFDYYYVDRGIIKWQGYYLSDHLNALKRDAEQRTAKLQWDRRRTRERVVKKERPEEDVQRLERKDNSIYFLSAEKH
ncbi:hypothetical protein PEAC54167_06430 [Pediococcus acidilactici]|uniref:hypothetical protein n=1 Tax=Pediococcus acidilactici TaxID=1254 RepID=UPI001E3E802E|nr:hypothetical protein [Pediococcus acidilactici]